MSKKIKSRTDIPEGVASLISPAVGRTSEGGGGGGGGVRAFFTVNCPFTESRNNCFSQFKLSLRAWNRNFQTTAAHYMSSICGSLPLAGETGNKIAFSAFQLIITLSSRAEKNCHKK